MLGLMDLKTLYLLYYHCIKIILIYEYVLLYEHNPRKQLQNFYVWG